MFKVNLETELRNQKQSVVNARELLLIKEHENLAADINAEQILTRVGINKSARNGKEIKTRMMSEKQQAAQFATDKVYHISQIEALCYRYALRFLPAANFKGSVPPELADKISTFETTYNVECYSQELKSFWHSSWDDWDEKKTNTYIVAPASSFNLQALPKDPLLLYKINENYYYLIHKWGNDLSVGRRLIAILGNKFLHTTIIFFVLASIAWFGRDVVILDRGSTFKVVDFIVMILALFFTIGYVLLDGNKTFSAKNQTGTHHLNLNERPRTTYKTRRSKSGHTSRIPEATQTLRQITFATWAEAVGAKFTNWADTGCRG